MQPNTQLHLIGKTRDAIISNEGLTLIPTVTFADSPPLNVIYVPDSGIGLKVMKDAEILISYNNRHPLNI